MLTTLNCISHLNVSNHYNPASFYHWGWMITNKFKINDSETEFIEFRSPKAKCALSGLSANVGQSQMTQSSKVRYSGVIFANILNFHDHLTAM